MGLNIRKDMSKGEILPVPRRRLQQESDGSESSTRPFLGLLPFRARPTPPRRGHAAGTFTDNTSRHWGFLAKAA